MNSNSEHYIKKKVDEIYSCVAGKEVNGIVIGGNSQSGTNASISYTIPEDGNYFLESTYRRVGSSGIVLTAEIKQNNIVITPFMNNYAISSNVYKSSALLPCKKNDVLNVQITSGGDNGNYITSSLSKIS